VGRDAGGAQRVGGRGVPVRRRPGVRDRAARRGMGGAGIRVPGLVRDQRDPGRGRAGTGALDPRDDARAPPERGDGALAVRVEATRDLPAAPERVWSALERWEEQARWIRDAVWVRVLT